MINFSNLHTKKFYKKIRRNWRECFLEYQEVVKIESIALVEFNKHLIKYMSEAGMDIPQPKTENKNESHKDHKDKFEKDEIKKIFREAAKLSHPDLDPTSSNMELFKELIQAKKENQLNKFLDIAKQIDNNIKNTNNKTPLAKTKKNNTETNESISLGSVDHLEKEVSDLETKIQKIKNSIHWTWYYASDSSRIKIIKKSANFINNEQNKKK